MDATQNLENQISKALLEQLTPEQLAEIDRMTDDPNVTEQQLVDFLQDAGVDFLGTVQQTAQNLTGGTNNV